MGWFGVTYRIPIVEYGVATTQLAINVAGALIPTAVSFYLLAKSSPTTIILSLVAALAVTLVNPCSS